MARLKWHTWVVLAAIATSYVIGFATAIITQAMWMAIALIIVGAVEGILIAYYFTRHDKRRRRLQYPLVPPEARPDMYAPRTDIPRPIHEDIRKMEERKRRMEKLRKMTHKIRRKKT